MNAITAPHLLARDISHEEMRDEEIRVQTKRHAAAIRANVATDHAQTIENIDEDVSFALSEPRVLAGMIRASKAIGVLTAGQMFDALVEKAIEARAEIAAVKEVERMERAGREEAFQDRISCRVLDRAMGQLPELTVPA